MQSLGWTGVKKDWDYEAVISRDKHGNIRGTALILIRRIPILGCSFLYSPYGPVCDYGDKETLRDIFEAIEVISKKYKGYELRIDPYGASTAAHRNVMPNYLMQWNMICWAVENKCSIYDFQGIPFYNDENHPNYRVYRFKRGFNGEVLTYAGEFVKCCNSFYAKLINSSVNISKSIFHFNPIKILN